MLDNNKTTQRLANISANISLVLSYAPLGLVRALSARIGRNGILADTGCITLSDNSEVGIVLSIRDGEQRITHRIRGRVSGRDSEGVLLAFEGCDRATLKALLPYVTLH